MPEGGLEDAPGSPRRLIDGPDGQVYDRAAARPHCHTGTREMISRTQLSGQTRSDESDNALPGTLQLR